MNADILPTLFPYLVAFDRVGRIVRVGPAWAEGSPDVAPEARFQDCFIVPGLDMGDDLTLLRPRTNARIAVRTVRSGLALGGKLLWVEDDACFVFAAELSRMRPSDFVGLTAAAASAEDSAAFLHHVLDSMPVLQLAIFDRNLRYVYVSPGAIINAEIRRWIIGRDDVEYCAFRRVDPQFAIDRQARLRHALSIGEIVTFEEVVHRPDARPRHFQRNISPVRDRLGRITHLLGFGWDITERKEAEAASEAYTRELKAEKERAEASNAAKGSFLANMSHELRTPLNVILGQAETVLEELYGPVTPEQSTSLQEIERQGQHLLQLISELLDFSRIESGKVEIAAEQVPLGPFLTQIVGAFARGAAEDHVTLRLEMPAAIGTVYADPFRLRQVLMNVIGNALKFTPRGGQVTVRVCAEADGATPAAVEVVDTGIGIAPERLEGIFEPFVQADASTTRAFGGTGLGLTISRRLCTLMGMSIGVTSELGRGATFVIGFAERGSPVVPAR